MTVHGQINYLTPSGPAASVAALRGPMGDVAAPGSLWVAQWLLRCPLQPPLLLTTRPLWWFPGGTAAAMVARRDPLSIYHCMASSTWGPFSTWWFFFSYIQIKLFSYYPAFPILSKFSLRYFQKESRPSVLASHLDILHILKGPILVPCSFHPLPQL